MTVIAREPRGSEPRAWRATLGSAGAAIAVAISLLGAAGCQSAGPEALPSSPAASSPTPTPTPTPGTVLQATPQAGSYRLAPQLTPSQTSVISLSAGQGAEGSDSSRICVVTSDGGGNCAGYGSGYVMGQPSAPTQTKWPQTPLPSTGALAGKKVAQIAAGGHVTCVLDDAGLPYCWGEPNNYFQGKPVGNESALLADSLGTAGPASPGVPAAVDTSGALAGKPLVYLDTRAYGGALTCGLDSQGAIYCWGAPWPQTKWPQPKQLAGGDGFTHIAIGMDGVCAIGRDSALYCWEGQSDAADLQPRRVDAVGKIKALSMGEVTDGSGVPGSACVTRADDTVMCINMSTIGRPPSEWRRVPQLDGASPIAVSRDMYMDYDTGDSVQVCGRLASGIVCPTGNSIETTAVPTPFNSEKPLALVIAEGRYALYPGSGPPGGGTAVPAQVDCTRAAPDVSAPAEVVGSWQVCHNAVISDGFARNVASVVTGPGDYKGIYSVSREKSFDISCVQDATGLVTCGGGTIEAGGKIYLARR